MTNVPPSPSAVNLDDEDYPEDLSAPPSYRDIAAVNGALRQLAALQRERTELEAAARAELERIHAWWVAQCARIDGRAAWVRTGLQGYLEYADLQKVRSPNGTAFLSRRAATLHVENQTALHQWLNADPEHARLGRTVLQPDMAAIQAHFGSTGEVPNGTVVVHEHDVLAVRLAPALTTKPQE